MGGCKALLVKTDGAVVKRVRPPLPRHLLSFFFSPFIFYLLIYLFSALAPTRPPPVPLSLACFLSAPTVCPPRTRALPKTISVHISVQDRHVRAMFTLRQDAPSENRALGCDSNVCSNVSEKKVTEGGTEGGKKRGGQWEKCFSPDDAVKLKSFDLCPKPYLHRLLSLLKALPPPAARPLEFFLSCHSPEEKYNIPLWLQLPLL